MYTGNNTLWSSVREFQSKNESPIIYVDVEGGLALFSQFNPEEINEVAM